jgi:hypothetical protein
VLRRVRKRWQQGKGYGEVEEDEEEHRGWEREVRGPDAMPW